MATILSNPRAGTPAHRCFVGDLQLFSCVWNRPPSAGRFLTPHECDRGTAAQVAVLSEPFWKTQFGADPHIVGGTIHLNGLPFTVIGILPSDAANFLSGGVFIPYTLQPVLDRGGNLLASPDSPWLGISARLRQGYSRADAQAELATILRQQDRAYVERKVSPLNRKTSVILTNGSFIQNPALQDLTLTLMALILGPLFLVLLLACSNVTMLFLSRAIVRRGRNRGSACARNRASPAHPNAAHRESLDSLDRWANEHRARVSRPIVDHECGRP
jgi:hypothetical protein